MSASDVEALRAYREALLEFVERARRRLNSPDDVQLVLHFDEQKNDSLAKLGSLREPALVAGCNAGASFETMTELLKDCQQACVEFVPRFGAGISSLIERTGRRLGPLHDLITLARAKGRPAEPDATTNRSKVPRPNRKAKKPKKSRNRQPRTVVMLLALLDDRRNANLNCSELAEAIGVHVSSVSRAFRHPKYGPEIMRRYRDYGIRPPGIHQI